MYVCIVSCSTGLYLGIYLILRKNFLEKFVHTQTDRQTHTAIHRN